MYAPISSQVSAPSYEPIVTSNILSLSLFVHGGVFVVQERSFCMDDNITVLVGVRGKF